MIYFVKNPFLRVGVEERVRITINKILLIDVKENIPQLASQKYWFVFWKHANSLWAISWNLFEKVAIKSFVA